MTLRAIPEEITTAIAEAKDRLPGAVLIVRHMLKQNRENCSCNKDPAMKIYRKADGWYFHCFRCAYQGFIPDDSQTPEQLSMRWKFLQAQQTKESMERITLPVDFKIMSKGSNDAPTEAWHWFWRYQIRDKWVQKYNIGWSESYQRVIIPCNVTNLLLPSGDYAYKLLGWSGREVYCKSKLERKEKGIMKYLTKKAKDVKHLFFHAPSPPPSEYKRIILVEDCISAIKIAELCGVSAIALLTTYIPENLMLRLQNFEVKIWLDGDMTTKAVSYVQKFKSQGFNVGGIYTEEDPKEYTYSELMDHLNPIKEE